MKRLILLEKMSLARSPNDELIRHTKPTAIQRKAFDLLGINPAQRAR